MHVQCRSRIDSRELSLSLIGSFFDRTNFFEPNERFLQKFESSLEVWGAKRKFSDNLGYNNLALYNVLMHTRLTTSKTKRDIWYRKLGIRVASPAAEDLRLRILGNEEILGKF